MKDIRRQVRSADLSKEKRKKKVIIQLSLISLIWMVAIFLAMVTITFMIKGLWLSALLVIACEVMWILSTRWIIKKNI